MYYSVSSEMSVALISEDVRQLGEQVKSVIDSMNGKQGGGRTRPDGPPARRRGPEDFFSYSPFFLAQ